MGKKFLAVLVIAAIGLGGYFFWPKEQGKAPAPVRTEDKKGAAKTEAPKPADAEKAAKKEAPSPKPEEEVRKSPSKSGTAALKPDEMPIAGTLTASKVVALTFDHSWGNTFTPRILATLKENNIKVTFFLMGPWSAQHPDVARQIVSDGHEVGSHGFRHENYGEKTESWIREDLNKSAAQIKAATGIMPVLFRPPNGHYNAQSLRITHELGYQSILWNIDSIDWMNPGRDVIIERILKNLKPGAIILMHASDTPQQTADALPILLGKIKEAGYRIVTVSELLNKYSEKGIVRE